MKVEAKNHLDAVLLPFWKKLRDEENGGYYGLVDYDLQVDKKAEKGVILHSRILWFFSNAYLTTKNEDDLQHAKHAYHFLTRHCMDKEYGGVFWSVHFDGTMSDGAKHTYNQAFAIYALSAYYEAAQDMDSLEAALAIFDMIEEKCKAPMGYNEAFTRDFKPSSNEKLVDNEAVTEKGVQATKTMNSVLHIVEAYTQLYKVSKNEKVGKALKDLLVLVEDKVYDNTDVNDAKLNVFFDDNYNSVVDMHSYGHDIEAAWLLDRGCDVLADKELTDAFADKDTALVDNVIKRAFNGHCVYNERVSDKIDVNRIWWVQAESVVGLINEYEKSGNKAYLDKANSVFRYIMDHMVDHRPGGEWHWQLDEHDEDTAKKPIVEPWKCPYHNGRMIFEIVGRDC